METWSPTPFEREERELDPRARRLQERARDFELPALANVLADMYPERPVVYLAHPGQTPEPFWVHDVVVYPKRVIVQLNMGLLSVASPLPDYFRELLADPRVGPPLARLLSAVDASLLGTRVEALRPGAGRLFPGDADIARRSFLMVQSPGSQVGLFWLFSSVFPELSVRVERASMPRMLGVDSVQLGRPVLGKAALGGRAFGQVTGFDVVLRTIESRTWGGEPWAAAARRRIDSHIVGVLGQVHCLIRVFLTDTTARTVLTLAGPAPLGFSPLKEARGPLVVIVADTASRSVHSFVPEATSEFGPTDTVMQQ